MKGQSLFQTLGNQNHAMPGNNHHIPSYITQQHSSTLISTNKHSSFPITTTTNQLLQQNYHPNPTQNTIFHSQNYKENHIQPDVIQFRTKDLTVQTQNNSKQAKSKHFSVSNRNKDDKNINEHPSSTVYQKDHKRNNPLFYSNLIGQTSSITKQKGRVPQLSYKDIKSIQPPFCYEKRHTLSFRPPNIQKFLVSGSQNKKQFNLKLSQQNLKLKLAKNVSPLAMKTELIAKDHFKTQYGKQNKNENETPKAYEDISTLKNSVSYAMTAQSKFQTNSGQMDTKRSESRKKSNFWVNKQALKMKTSQFINPFDIKKKPFQYEIKDFTLDCFEMQDKIGKGSFGDVYLAKEKLTGFIVVIKKLLKKKIIELKLEQHLMRQIKIQSYLKHRHLTSLYGCFADESFIYLILQAMPDGSLMQMNKKRRICEQKVSIYMKQICQGLKSMHVEQVIHRDIKPQNIFLFEDYVKIGDFGCSIHANGLRNTIIGSLAYFSPEQLKNESYDQKIDIWSLGVLTYEMLTGKSPYQEDIMKIAKHEKQPELSELRFPEHLQISEDAKSFIKKTLHLDPNCRLGISEALNHRFIQKYNQQQN